MPRYQFWSIFNFLHGPVVSLSSYICPCINMRTAELWTLLHYHLEPLQVRPRSQLAPKTNSSLATALNLGHCLTEGESEWMSSCSCTILQSDLDTRRALYICAMANVRVPVGSEVKPTGSPFSIEDKFCVSFYQPVLQHEKKECFLVLQKIPIMCQAWGQVSKGSRWWYLSGQLLKSNGYYTGNQLLQHEHFSLILCSQKPRAQLLASGFNIKSKFKVTNKFTNLILSNSILN